MKQAQSIIISLLLTFIVISIQAQNRSDLHVYGETLASVETEFMWEESESEKVADQTSIQSKMNGEEIVIRTDISEVDQVLVYDMNGMLYDNDIISQSDEHITLSFKHIASGEYIISLERASGHESFQIVKSNN